MIHFNCISHNCHPSYLTHLSIQLITCKITVNLCSSPLISSAAVPCDPSEGLLRRAGAGRMTHSSLYWHRSRCVRHTVRQDRCGGPGPSALRFLLRCGRGYWRSDLCWICKIGRPSIRFLSKVGCLERCCIIPPLSVRECRVGSLKFLTILAEFHSIGTTLSVLYLGWCGWRRLWGNSSWLPCPKVWAITRCQSCSCRCLAAWRLIYRLTVWGRPMRGSSIDWEWDKVGHSCKPWERP